MNYVSTALTELREWVRAAERIQSERFCLSRVPRDPVRDSFSVRTNIPRGDIFETCGCQNPKISEADTIGANLGIDP